MPDLDWAIEHAEAEVTRLKRLKELPAYTLETWLAGARLDCDIPKAVVVRAGLYPEQGGYSAKLVRLSSGYISNRPFISEDERPVAMRGSRVGMRALHGCNSNLRDRNSTFASRYFWRLVRTSKCTIFTEKEWLSFAHPLWDRVVNRLVKQGFGDFDHNRGRWDRGYEFCGRDWYVGLENSSHPRFLLNGRVVDLWKIAMGGRVPRRVSRKDPNAHSDWCDACDKANIQAAERASVMLSIHAVDKKMARLPA